MYDDEEDIELEELEFINNFAATGDLAEAAKGAIVPWDASDRQAAITARKALASGPVRAYIIDKMEEGGLTFDSVIRTIKRNLTVRKNGIVQKTGDVVDLGDDSQGQLGAAKLALQLLGTIGGGIKEETVEDQENKPQTVNVFFGSNSLYDDDEEEEKSDVIDLEPGQYTSQ